MTAIITRPTRAIRLMEPFYRPLDTFSEVELLARKFWDSWQPLSSRAIGFSPRMDMYEHKDELVMRVEFPGVKKEDIDVSLEGDELTIEVEKKREEVAEEACYYSCERSFGHYSRTISLPFPVDADKISSTFENGLLEVKLPKAEAAKAKHIEVKVS